MGVTTLPPTANPRAVEYVESVLNKVRSKNPGEVEFLQAVQEVLETLTPPLAAHPEYEKHKILERLVEPERVVMFRVPWVDDRGEVFNGPFYHLIVSRLKSFLCPVVFAVVANQQH